MEDLDEDAEWEYSPDPMPVWGCKHCEFTMPYCIDGFDSEEPEAMFVHLMRIKHEVVPGASTDTLPLFPDEHEHNARK